MQVGDALVGVDHGEIGAIGKRGFEGCLDLLAIVELVQALQDGAQAVFAVEAG